MSNSTLKVSLHDKNKWSVTIRKVSIFILVTLFLSIVIAQEDSPEKELAQPEQMLSVTPAIHINKVLDYHNDKHLLIDSESSFALPENIIQAIDHEIPLSFKIEIELLEKSKMLGYEYNRQRSHIQFHNQIYSSGVNHLYALFNTRNFKVRTFTNLDEALQTLATLKGFPVASLSELHPGQSYTLRIRINLDYWKLPAPLILEALLTDKWLLDSQWYETSLKTPLSWQ